MMNFALGFASGLVACMVAMYLLLVYLDRRDHRPPTEPDVDGQRLKESSDRLYGGGYGGSPAGTPTCFRCGATMWVNLDTMLCDTCQGKDDRRDDGRGLTPEQRDRLDRLERHAMGRGWLHSPKHFRKEW